MRVSHLGLAVALLAGLAACKKVHLVRPARASGWSVRTAFRDARCNARTTKSWSRPIAGRRAIRRNSSAKEARPAARYPVPRIRL